MVSTFVRAIFILAVVNMVVASTPNVPKNKGYYISSINGATAHLKGNGPDITVTLPCLGSSRRQEWNFNTCPFDSIVMEHYLTLPCSLEIWKQLQGTNVDSRNAMKPCYSELYRLVTNLITGFDFNTLIS